MNKDMLSKTLIMGIVLLFFGISITSTIGISNSYDDTTPPVTTISLNPPIPDGLNGWYVNDLNVTLNATDDISGVKEIKYRVDGGPLQTITGDNGTFILDVDGDDIEVEYWAIDNVGNEELRHYFEIDMDQTDPIIDLGYEYIVEGNDNWKFVFTATATDAMSSMERVEFYVDYELIGIQYGSGPTFMWEIPMDIDISAWGFIINRNITEEYVKFLAIDVYWVYQNNYPHLVHYAIAYDDAGNNESDHLPGFHPELPKEEKYKWFTFSNDYTGYIGRYFIFADFEEKPINVTPGAYNPNLENIRLLNIISFHTLFLRLIERFPVIREVFLRLINPVK